MAKKYSLLSWNIENFGLDKTDKAQIVQSIKGLNPDIFALLEVVGADVWRYMFDEFPNHSFFITEGEQSQEILIGVHKKFKVFLTQRDEFKSGRSSLRPGAFISFKFGTDVYTVLFLHLKSMPDPEGFGLRDSMLDHAFSLKGALDNAAGGAGKANFIMMGDLNTMGLSYPYDSDIPADVELKRLSYRAGRRGMRLLPKIEQRTWTDGEGNFSDLDHVIASNQIEFNTWGNANVKVIGWNKYPEDSIEFTNFVENVSDHCALYCEVI